MKRNPTKTAEEARHEAKVRAAVAKFNRSPEAKEGTRVLLESESDPVVQVANRVFQKAARRKVN